MRSVAVAGPMSHMWYVKVSGRVWGPYPEARLAEFVQEGRVGPGTPVSPFATGPFAPAAGNPEFAPLLAHRARAQASPPATHPTSAATAEVVTVERAPAPAHHPRPEDGPCRGLLVWAELSEPSREGFHAALAASGSGVAIRPGLWLVQARINAAGLRNLLSRRLGPADALMVVEARLDEAAWFNVEPARDRELRRLWAAMGG